MTPKQQLLHDLITICNAASDDGVLASGVAAIVNKYFGRPVLIAAPATRALYTERDFRMLEESFAGKEISVREALWVGSYCGPRDHGALVSVGKQFAARYSWRVASGNVKMYAIPVRDPIA